MASIDKALEEELLEVGNKLLDPPSSVDNLLHLLRQVRRCLSRVGQLPTDSMHNALSPSLKALIADKLIKHSDGDVKVALAYCLIYLTRITAPDAPYNEHQMEEVLRLIVSSFENLHDKSSRWYEKRILILKIFAEVKLCLEMLNLECDTLILEMFQNFFKTIREHHPEKVFSSMKTIMVLVLEESDDISLDLLSPILDCLKKENEVVLPIARKLGESVLESCATKVKPYLRKAVNKLGISLDDYSDVLASVCTVLLEASESEIVRSSAKRSSSSKGSGSSKKKTRPSSGSKIKGASESSFGSDSPKIKKRKLRKVGLTAAKEISAKQLPIISEETGDVPLIKKTRTSKTTASKVPPSSSTRAASEVSAAVATEAPQAEGNSETLPNVTIAEISQSRPSTPPAQTISTLSPPSSQRITNDKPELEDPSTPSPPPNFETLVQNSDPSITIDTASELPPPQITTIGSDRTNMEIDSELIPSTTLASEAEHNVDTSVSVMDSEAIQASEILKDLPSTSIIPVSESQNIVDSGHNELVIPDDTNNLTLTETASELPPPPPTSDPELANLCNIIVKRVKKLHRLRYSFVEPNEYLSTWESLRGEINQELDKVQTGDLNDLATYQENLGGWVNSVNSEVDKAKLRKQGHLSLTDKFFYDEALKTSVWKDNVYSLDSDLNMHLKFSLQPGDLFVKKEISENPAMEAFKVEVKEELAAQRAKMEDMSAKQEVIEQKIDGISSDVKTLISLFQNRNP